VTLIDLGDTGHADEPWDPPGPGVAKVLRDRRRELIAVVVAAVVLLLPQASAPASGGSPPVELPALTGADDLRIVDDVAVGLVPDSSAVVGVAIGTGRVRWQRSADFFAVADPADGLVTVVSGADGRTRPETQLVDARTGQTIARAEGLPLAAAVDGLQPVRLAGGDRIVGLRRGGSWSARWERNATTWPVFHRGRVVPELLVVAADGAASLLDLASGAIRPLGRLPRGDLPIGVYDGLVQSISHRTGSATVTLYRPVAGLLDALWSQPLETDGRRGLFACGGLLCEAGQTGTVGLDPQDASVIWAAGRFSAIERIDQPFDGPLLAGRLQDAMRREQGAVLDAGTGRVVARLGGWEIAGVADGHALVFLRGRANQAWLGSVDLAGAQPIVQPRTRLSRPVDACTAAGRWAVCLSGVAGQAPFAVTLEQPMGAGAVLARLT